MLDDGFPAYTQVSHVSNVSRVFRFRLRVGQQVSCLHPGITCPLMSHVFLGLGCVLDNGFPAYTQVSHVSNVSRVFRFRLCVR